MPPDGGDVIVEVLGYDSLERLAAEHPAVQSVERECGTPLPFCWRGRTVILPSFHSLTTWLRTIRSRTRAMASGASRGQSASRGGARARPARRRAAEGLGDGGAGHRCGLVSVLAATLHSVGATYSVDDDTNSAGHSLRRGASPRAIRSALLPDDQIAFDTAYTAALADARVSLDLTALFEMLERWRRMALLQQDPTRFHALARRAAELLTGAPIPDDEPLAVTRVKAGI